MGCFPDWKVLPQELGFWSLKFQEMLVTSKRKGGRGHVCWIRSDTPVAISGFVWNGYEGGGEGSGLRWGWYDMTETNFMDSNNYALQHSVHMPCSFRTTKMDSWRHHEDELILWQSLKPRGSLMAFVGWSDRVATLRMLYRSSLGTSTAGRVSQMPSRWSYSGWFLWASTMEFRQYPKVGTLVTLSCQGHCSRWHLKRPWILLMWPGNVEG